MAEPIASPSSPINAKTQKTQRKNKGKAKVVSPNSATVDRKPSAHTAASESSSDHDHDGIIESVDYGDFDYDAVKADDGVELWLVRVPSTVRPVPRPNLRMLSRSLLALLAFSFSTTNQRSPCYTADESEKLARPRD
jgi:hypothetical protein